MVDLPLALFQMSWKKIGLVIEQTTVMYYTISTDYLFFIILNCCNSCKGFDTTSK
jgi:hypothetical protein